MRSLLAVWLIAILSLTNPASGNLSSYLMQEETPVTFEEYWELVRNTRQAVVQLEAESASDVREQLDALAMQWENIRQVRLSDESIVAVNPSFLVNELRADPPNLGRLQGLLDALLSAHDEYPQRVFTIQDVEPLNQILARPEFQWDAARVIELPDWLQGIFDALADLMDRIAFALRNAAYYGRVPLIVAGVVLFLFSLYFISRNLSRSLVSEAELAAKNSDDALLTSKGAMQRAQTLSSQGDYRNAIRYLYLSSLLALDEQGLLRYDRSRTNREYLRSVASKPNLATPLRDVIDVFDRVWYGYESVDEQTYQSYVKHVDELQEGRE